MTACSLTTKAVVFCGAAALCLGSMVLSADGANGTGEPDGSPEWRPSPNPARLPNVPLERLSSGALLRLDQGGDLVEPTQTWASRIDAASRAAGQTRKAAVALDPRVGANIRLGDDPAALPQDRRAQAEPHIARAPNDSDFLLATFQEGRFETGGGADCGYAVTHDGGLTWRRALIPFLGPPSGGPYERATDPVAGIDHAGVAYLNTLGLLNNVSRGVVVVSRSNDRGNTWTAPLVAYDDPTGQFFADKNWMAVNSFTGTSTPAGRVLVTWTQFPNTQATNHPVMRVFSDDGGETWSPPGFIHTPDRQVQGSQPMFLRDGRVAIPYWNFNYTETFADDFLEMVVSNDGGNTFGPPKFITNVRLYGPPNIRTGGFLPSATTDRATGTIYITYQTFVNGSPRIMFTKSSNAGDTWTTPIPISDNPAGSGVFNPAIAVSPDGQTVTVAFYDFRDNPGSAFLVDMYLAQSFNGGATWQPNIRLSSESTDASRAVNTGSPNNPAYMLGDYQGIAEATNRDVPAVPLWVDTRTGGPDPFVTRVGIAPQVDFTSWQAARLSLGQIDNPASGGESADADGDGVQNSSEFANGSDPNELFHTGRQLNISTRARVGSGENIVIGGFIVTGSEPKRVIVRALGPSLDTAGVAGSLQDPTLRLLTDNDVVVAENDDWPETQQSEIAATGIAPPDDREAAIVRTLAPGNYTAAVSGKSNATGVALVEVYDLAPDANSRLGNISTRSFVGGGENVMIAGLIIGAGNSTSNAGSARIVLRGLGPSLTQTDVADALQDPELLLFDANGAIIQTNDNWRQTQQNELQSLNIAPSDNREAALVASLPRGNYTAIVRGRELTTGVALVEAYNVQ